MTNATRVFQNERFILKPSAGWFAAGEPFSRAMNLLSDGAFKLFALLCLQADRHTGRHAATHRELAVALGKSKRIVGVYVTELQAKAICDIVVGKNQFAPTIFEIREEYWPYHRSETSGTKCDGDDDYVIAVRESFLSFACTRSVFARADEETARALKMRGISLETVQDAMLMGAMRKYVSGLNGASCSPIVSMQYFESVIAEIQAEPWPDGYREYLQTRSKRFAELWRETCAKSL